MASSNAPIANGDQFPLNYDTRADRERQAVLQRRSRLVLGLGLVWMALLTAGLAISTLPKLATVGLSSFKGEAIVGALGMLFCLTLFVAALVHERLGGAAKVELFPWGTRIHYAQGVDEFRWDRRGRTLRVWDYSVADPSFMAGVSFFIGGNLVWSRSAAVPRQLVERIFDLSRETGAEVKKLPRRPWHSLPQDSYLIRGVDQRARNSRHGSMSAPDVFGPPG